jgi:exportin-2 (importin alpha re-exporter)
VEQFEDDPEEYIRADIEGSDADTRRRAVCELIKELRKYFKKEVTEIFTPYVDALMQVRCDLGSTGTGIVQERELNQ